MGLRCFLKTKCSLPNPHSLDRMGQNEGELRNLLTLTLNTAALTHDHKALS